MQMSQARTVIKRYNVVKLHILNYPLLIDFANFTILYASKVKAREQMYQKTTIKFVSKSAIVF